MNTSSRRPATARATTRSAPPSPYISAVSISVMPCASAASSAATSVSASRRRSPMRHVPTPSAGTRVPSANATVGSALDLAMVAA